MGKESVEEIKIFDGIHRTPIDKTARLVVQKGEHYNSPAKRQEGLSHWDFQPNFFNIPHGSSVRKGERFGRLVVLGKRNMRKIKGKATRYVVRCDCGDFEIRTYKGLVGGLNTENDRCYICSFEARRNKIKTNTQHTA